MAGTMPRTTNREPWDIAQAFIELMHRKAEKADERAFQLDTLPLEERIKQRMAKFQSDLGVDAYGRQQAIREPYDIRQDERQNRYITDREQSGRDFTLRRDEIQQGYAIRRGEIDEDREKRRLQFADELQRQALPQKTDEAIRQGVETRRGTNQADIDSYNANPQYYKDRYGGRRGLKIAPDQNIVDVDPQDIMSASEMDENKDWEPMGIFPDSNGKAVKRYKRKGSLPNSVESGVMPLPAERRGPTGRGDSQTAPTPTTPAPAPPAGPAKVLSKERPLLTPEQIQEEKNNPGAGKDGWADPPAELSTRGSRGDRQSELPFRPLRTFAQMPQELKPTVAAAARVTGVPADFLAAVAFQESGWRNGRTSSAGAQGLMQIMPDTARGLGVNPWNRDEAFFGGAEYLKEALDKYDGNYGLALIYYNAGPKGAQRFIATGRLPAETRNYVKSITGMSPEAWHPRNMQQAKANTQDDDPLFWVA